MHKRGGGKKGKVNREGNKKHGIKSDSEKIEAGKDEIRKMRYVSKIQAGGLLEKKKTGEGS